MRAIGLADSAQKRGKSAKIREFSRKFIHSFSRNLVLHLFFKVHQLVEFEIQQSQGLSRNSKKNKFRIALEGL
jgi:hypothetical protein